MKTTNFTYFNSKFKFDGLKNTLFVASQLQILKRFSHLNSNEAVRQMTETPDDVCCHYKKYVMTIKSLIYQAQKLCDSDKAIFYDMLNDEYFKPRQLFFTCDEDISDYEHMRIMDFVIYKFVMVEPILDVIKTKDMGTAIFYHILNEKLTMEAPMTSVERDEEIYDVVHDETYEFLNTKTYSECNSLFEKHINDKLHVYAIQPYERTLDFDEHHQRTADMVEKPVETPKSLKRQRSQ